MTKKIDYSFLPCSTTNYNGYTNKYIRMYLEEDNPLAKNILESIYFIGRGFATKKNLKSYFNLSDKQLRNVLEMLKKANLIEVRNYNTPNSYIALTIAGASYVQKRVVKAIPDNYNAYKTNSLYYLATLLKHSNYHTFFLEKHENRESYICKEIEKNHICNYPNASIGILEEKRIYLTKCSSNKFEFAILSASTKHTVPVAKSIFTKIVLALYFVKTYIDLEDADISFVIVADTTNKEFLERVIHKLSNGTFGEDINKELIKHLNNKQLGITLDKVLNFRINVI